MWKLGWETINCNWITTKLFVFCFLIAPKNLLSSDSVPQSIKLEGCEIKLADTIRNLDVSLDPALSFQHQISSLWHTYYLELCRISATRHYLSEDVTKKLLCTCVLSKLHYRNSLSAGCPKYFLSKFQEVQNNAARLILRALRSAHVTLLFTLHWLPVERRLEYKLSLPCFEIIPGQAPTYLLDLPHFCTPSRQLRSSADTRLFRIHSSRTKACGQHSFSYQNLTTWNQLPVSVLSNLPLKHFSFPKLSF